MLLWKAAVLPVREMFAPPELVVLADEHATVTQEPGECAYEGSCNQSSKFQTR
jgi:hypothetical protein